MLYSRGDGLTIQVTSFSTVQFLNTCYLFIQSFSNQPRSWAQTTSGGPSRPECHLEEAEVICNAQLSVCMNFTLILAHCLLHLVPLNNVFRTWLQKQHISNVLIPYSGTITSALKSICTQLCCSYTSIHPSNHPSIYATIFFRGRVAGAAAYAGRPRLPVPHLDSTLNTRAHTRTETIKLSFLVINALIKE